MDLSLHLLETHGLWDRSSIMEPPLYELQNLDHNSEPCSIVLFLDSSVSSVIHTTSCTFFLPALYYFYTPFNWYFGLLVSYVTARTLWYFQRRICVCFELHSDHLAFTSPSISQDTFYKPEDSGVKCQQQLDFFNQPQQHLLDNLSQFFQNIWYRNFVM